MVIPPLIIGVVINLLNALGHYLAINVFKLSLNFSALMQTLCYAVQVTLLVLYLYITKRYKATFKGFTRQMSCQWGQWFLLALPGLLMLTLEWIIFEIGTILAGTINTVQLSAQTSLFQIENISFILQAGAGVMKGCGLQKIGAGLTLLCLYGIGLPTGVCLMFLCDYGIKGQWWGLVIGATVQLIITTPIVFLINIDKQVKRTSQLISIEGTQSQSGWDIHETKSWRKMLTARLSLGFFFISFLLIPIIVISTCKWHEHFGVYCMNPDNETHAFVSVPIFGESNITILRQDPRLSYDKCQSIFVP
ncbi:hypothetical protein Ciccas_004624 [Cichlidogyrus casuarinus]|uniref:Uncharacterized protein n=1 Tax=Cichlidogyrus casuarinus TaxID=1844966 RepID=A0ABD2QBX0_9PLAT